MKTLFEKYKGARAFITLTHDSKMDGKVGDVYDQYVKLETTYSGPEQFIYIPFSAIVRVHFDPA